VYYVSREIGLTPKVSPFLCFFPVFSLGLIDILGAWIPSFFLLRSSLGDSSMLVLYDTKSLATITGIIFLFLCYLVVFYLGALSIFILVGIVLAS